MRPTTPRQGSPRAAVAVACVALFTDMFVYGLAIPVLPLLPATVGAGPAATGLLFASYAAAMLAATPVAGVLVDRFGSRVPLVVGLLGLAAATLLFAVGGPFWLLLVARTLQGAAAGAAWVAGFALIAAAVPLASRGRAMGLAMSMVSVGILVGPPVGGVLVEQLGTTAPFLLAAALAVVDGIVRLLLAPSAEPVRDDPTSPLTVLRVPGTASVLAVALLSAATIAAIEPLLPLHLTRSLDATPVHVGLLFGLTVLVGAVLNPVVGGLLGRVDARFLVLVGVVAAVAGLVLVAVGSSSGAVVVGMVALGVAVAFFSAPSTTLVGIQGQQTAPPALGGAYTLFNLAYATGLMVGPALGGVLTETLGHGRGLVVLAGLVLAGGLVALRRLPSARWGGA
ncbi:MFS transporter [Cellulosimicrobium cellulans]|uniref:MFS transporter n=1 Tax=Cellulosimicrobium cellulans TaxID=1710 RepID=UPI001BA4D7F8|nr:MFS transporter [Cellulosimicrobium cellulans]QUB99522.1 MFS transporter [Cellulosimicrobium cellulans]